VEKGDTRPIAATVIRDEGERQTRKRIRLSELAEALAAARQRGRSSRRSFSPILNAEHWRHG